MAYKVNSLEEMPNALSYLVYGWVSAKQIPVHKINKALAFLQSEIDDWLKNKSHKTQDDLMEEARRFVESKKIIR